MIQVLSQVNRYGCCVETAGKNMVTGRFVAIGFNAFAVLGEILLVVAPVNCKVNSGLEIFLFFSEI